MKEDHSTHKEYFTSSYQTGSDIWTHIPYQETASQILPLIEKDSLVLDVGAGRGLWAKKLVDLGYKVLGIDYVQSVVEKVNEQIKADAYADRAKFVTADALQIPFIDSSFHLATDIGTLQHMSPDQYTQYISEICRVLGDGGYYLNMSLSNKTSNFLGLNPSKEAKNSFIKFGVHYNFFSEDDIANIFRDNFTAIDQQFMSYPSQSGPEEEVVLIFTLMQKK